MRFLYFLLFFIFSCHSLHGYLFVGNASKELAETLADQLGIPLGNCSIDRFNDGEINIRVCENVENKDVYILQSTCNTINGSVNDHFMELFLLARALKRGHAEKITAILPYYGYSRQDRGTGVPISASEVAHLIEASGIKRVIAFDVHSKQIQGFFHEASLDSLDPSPVFASHLKDKVLHKPVVVAPDAGAIDRALSLQKHLKNLGMDPDMAIIIKKRAKAGVIESVNLLGDIEGCDAILVDDICDSAGTLVAAGTELKRMGANNIIACVTHPVFSNPAIERIETSVFSEVLVTNTIPLRLEHPKIKQLSIVPILSEKLKNSSVMASMKE